MTQFIVTVLSVKKMERIFFVFINSFNDYPILAAKKGADGSFTCKRFSNNFSLFQYFSLKL
jgi:hypothetical protein